jgi:hypothetical protein
VSERLQLWLVFAVCLLATLITAIVALDRWKAVEAERSCQMCVEKEWDREMCRDICGVEEENERN